MRYGLILTCFCILLLIAIIIGAQNIPRAVQTQQSTEETMIIPSIGRIQVLNACGSEGAALKIADYLRENKFDVKNIGNAPSWNYNASMIVSRITDLTIAEKIGTLLKTDKITLMRTTGEQPYDATVFVGADYAERLP